MGVFEDGRLDRRHRLSGRLQDPRTRRQNGLGFSGASKGLRRFDLAFREWLGTAGLPDNRTHSGAFPGTKGTENSARLTLYRICLFHFAIATHHIRDYLREPKGLGQMVLEAPLVAADVVQWLYSDASYLDDTLEVVSDMADAPSRRHMCRWTGQPPGSGSCIRTFVRRPPCGRATERANCVFTRRITARTRTISPARSNGSTRRMTTRAGPAWRMQPVNSRRVSGHR